VRGSSAAPRGSERGAASGLYLSMAIKFYCSCGKHLRAREAMAGRRSQCPACGQPVGIPTLEPTHRGAPAPHLSLAERQKQSSLGLADFPVYPLSPAEAEATLEKAQPGRAQRKPRPRRVLALETRWYQCLAFPFYAWPLLGPLALALTVLTVLGAAAYPHVDIVAAPAWVWLVGWTVPFLACGYIAAFLQCVLASAAAGETGFVRWPGADVGLIARALGIWLICFLAGPIVFFAVAFLFWFHVGDPAAIDWLIVIELCVAGLGHWFLALVALHQTDRFIDANPARVAVLIRRLGYGAVLATLAAAGVALALGWIILQGLLQMPDEPAIGMAVVAGGWMLVLGWLAFLFRLLGLWCYRSRVEPAEATPSPQLV
jgi:hypothetical protein